MGGLNDTLNQIEMCWRYCVATGRTLILDSQTSGLLDQWDHYFDVVPEKREQLLIFRDEMTSEFNRMSCRPKCLEGRLGSYSSEAIAGVGCLERPTGEKIAFDMQYDHPEELLVHHQFGGGLLSYDSIQYFMLRQELAQAVGSLREQHPQYVSIHIRNTDYQTEYQGLFHAVLAQEQTAPVLICSDDRACKDYAKQVFGSRAFFVTDTPDTQGKSLHDNPQLDRFTENRNMLIDLCMLAFGDRFYCTQTRQGLYSGFSILANYLNSNRPALARFVSQYSHGP